MLRKQTLQAQQAAAACWPVRDEHAWPCKLPWQPWHQPINHSVLLPFRTFMFAHVRSCLLRLDKQQLSAKTSVSTGRHRPGLAGRWPAATGASKQPDTVEVATGTAL